MPVASRSFQTINPATGEVLAEIPEASKADLNTAVDAARDGFRPDGPWRSMPTQNESVRPLP